MDASVTQRGAVPSCQLSRVWQGEQSAARGGPFAVLNGATATDVVCVAVPAGVQLEQPIHLLHISASAPPLLCIMPLGPSCHFRAR